MKTKEQAQEWFSERMAVSKESAESIITTLNACGIYGVYIQYMSEGATRTGAEVITSGEFRDWFYSELAPDAAIRSVTEIAELQRQIDERNRLLEHIFFVLKGDVTRRIMRTDVPLAAQIVDLLVEVMANKKTNE